MGEELGSEVGTELGTSDGMPVRKNYEKCKDIHWGILFVQDL